MRGLDGLLGRRMPGGCDDCNAIQQLTASAPGVYSLRVFHDTTCPTLAAKQNQR